MKEHWDQFWRSHQHGAALTNTEVGAAVLQAGWEQFFADLRHRSPPLRVLDLACGAGEVARTARRVLGVDAVVTGVDYAPEAIAALQGDAAFDEARVEDAAALSLDDGSVTVVVSQFGAEYAGLTAFAEAGRVLAAGGQLRIVSHLTGGPIHEECHQNGVLTRRILDIGVLDKALVAFRQLQQVQSGAASQSTLLPLLQEVNGTVPAYREALRATAPQAPARQFAERLFADLSHIMGRVLAFEAGELIRWTQTMLAESQAYAARMDAMVAAAMDAGRIGEAGAILSAAGVTMTPAQQIRDREVPFAWVLEGYRAEVSA